MPTARGLGKDDINLGTLSKSRAAASYGLHFFYFLIFEYLFIYLLAKK